MSSCRDICKESVGLGNEDITCIPTGNILVVINARLRSFLEHPLSLFVLANIKEI